MFRPLHFVGLWLVALATCCALAWTVDAALDGPVADGARAETIAFSAPAGVLVRY